MYVDKTLSGLNAVQTLSRLNRIHPDKDGTFVLDFRNDAEEIRDAFEPYYGETVAPPSDPNLLYDTRHALDEFGVLWPDEIERGRRAAADRRPAVDHGRIHAALGPAIDRFDAPRRRRAGAVPSTPCTGSCAPTGSCRRSCRSPTPSCERDYLFCRALAAFVKVDPVTRGGRPRTLRSNSPTCASSSSSRAPSPSTRHSARS